MSDLTFRELHRGPSGMSPMAQAANKALSRVRSMCFLFGIRICFILTPCLSQRNRGRLDPNKDLVFDTRSSEECDAW